jgi:hypothetical protein
MKTHTEACYADECDGIVTFNNRQGVCPRCGIAQRIVIVKSNVSDITERK